MLFKSIFHMTTLWIQKPAKFSIKSINSANMELIEIIHAKNCNLLFKPIQSISNVRINFAFSK